ncbi:MAG: ComF family protein [Fimbriimonadales bacterium]
MEDFAGRLARRLGVLFVPALTKTRATQPQKEFKNAVQKAKNIEGAFEVAQTVQGLNLLIVDDVFDSGATLKEAGKVLKQAGAGALYAFCLARTRHRGDL